jgi:hypothetical protein
MDPRRRGCLGAPIGKEGIEVHIGMIDLGRMGANMVRGRTP